MPASLTTILIPGLFVFIWATGFVTARLVMPHAEPLMFVAVRLVVTTVLLAGIAQARRVRWPSGVAAWREGLICGALMQGAYLGAVFWSVSHGLPAGIAALLGSLQPLLTAGLAGPLLGETVRPRRWAGIGVGFLGVGLVLAPKLGAVGASGIPLVPLGVCFTGILAITLGTIRQKRALGGTDLLANGTIQFLGACALLVPLAASFGQWRFEPGWPLAIGFGWSVLVNSVASILLVLALIRRGAVVGFASLLFLVPPVSAVIAYLMFGETLSPAQIAGMAVAAAGVALASRA